MQALKVCSKKDIVIFAKRIIKRITGISNKRHLMLKIEMLKINLGFYFSIIIPPVLSQPKFFIGGCPRSGTTLLFEILRNHNMIKSFPIESDEIWRKFNYPRHNLLQNEQLSKEDATPFIKKRIRQIIRLYMGNTKIFLEKNPANCLRVPFLLEVFPDGKLIFIIRDGKEVINSLMEGWKLYPNFTFCGSKKTAVEAYPRDYPHIKVWHFHHPPNWEKYRNSCLADICFYQWVFCAENMIKHMKELKNDQLYAVDYHKLIKNPIQQVKKVLQFMHLKMDDAVLKMCSKMEPTHSITKPYPEKWKDQNRQAIEMLIPQIDKVNQKLFRVAEEHERGR
jgi:hypothetical protein